ncbi:heavy-metal-associated domain-containing protein [Lachnospiraceae bacterium OttesenSCG-928-J05]|nr:heavy-metal-associated domain-containing protein [Lachnospiraceae bacterium OttesenSCG-928-J05]
MVKIAVEGMHCGNCVARIEKLFAEENIIGSVSLDEEQVTLNEESQVAAALEALEDLGFGGKVVE